MIATTGLLRVSDSPARRLIAAELFACSTAKKKKQRPRIESPVSCSSLKTPTPKSSLMLSE